jgi:hypothetical protein
VLPAELLALSNLSLAACPIPRLELASWKLVFHCKPLNLFDPVLNCSFYSELHLIPDGQCNSEREERSCQSTPPDSGQPHRLATQNCEDRQEC